MTYVDAQMMHSSHSCVGMARMSAHVMAFFCSSASCTASLALMKARCSSVSASAFAGQGGRYLPSAYQSRAQTPMQAKKEPTMMRKPNHTAVGTLMAAK